MDVKSDFLYGKIEEEVYVCQPPRFEDPDFPNKVYKVKKALYGLHQAPRAWYETLSIYLLDNRFQRGKINKTLFIKRHKGDILLVQVYVDDIIFGSTKKELCIAFKKLVHEKFQMNSMGELTLFLGLQVQRKKDGIFISQDKYVGEILKKLGFTEVKTASTPMETQKSLLKDEDGEEVDVHMYRLMIRYLKGQPKLGLWYPKDSPFYLVAYTDSDYAGASLDRKSTTGDLLTKAFDDKQRKSVRLMMEKLIIRENRQKVLVKTVNGEVQLQALVDRKKIIITKSTVRRDLQLEDVEGVDCLPNATIFKQLTLMGYEKISQKLTFYKAFFSPKWKFLIHTILQCLSSKTTAWNEFSITMASAIICLATNQKFNFSKYIFESMVKNLDNMGNFLMYPRFVQVFLDKQLEGMATHNGIYIAPSHTKKIFGNMRRVGKGFSGRETPLFQTMVVQDQADMGKGLANPTDPHHTPTIIQPSTSQPQKKQKPRKPKRKDTQIPQSSGPTDNVADEAVNEEMDDSLERPVTTATSLDADQDMGNINKTQSKATPNESSSLGTTSGGGPRCQETIGDTIAQTRFENVSKTSNDPLLVRGNTLQSGEDSLKHNELMELCTNLQQRVLDLETTKTTQANEIASLKRRVKKLERRNKLRTHGLKRLYRVGSSRRVESSKDEGLGEEDASKQGRIANIDVDEDITLVNDQDDVDMFGVNDLDGDEVIVETTEETRSVVEEVTAVSEKAKLVSAAATPVSTASTIPVSAATTTTTTTTITEVEITLAQALAELKSAKPKADKVVIQEPEYGTTTTTTAAIIITAASSRPKAKGIVKDQDKGKGKMVKPEPVNKMSKKDPLKLDEELAFKLQAEEEEERLAREKAQQIEETNIA
ncbi:putative ribonuclease H-like domain-containing protein [Tanacetum coccineum]